MKLIKPNAGFTLVELAIAMAIAALLIIASVQLAIATSSSYQLQQNLGALQENARYALNTIQSELEAAGYVPQPWNTAFDGWSIDGEDTVSANSDRIVVRRWSDRNCFENSNPLIDEAGLPRFYLRETAFFINGSKNLAQNCKYGPDSGQLTTQVNNLGLVEHAEALQFLYAEDADDDGLADRWVTARQWSDELRILGVRAALLLATPSNARSSGVQTIQVLNTEFTAPDDSRKRMVFESVVYIKSRTR